MIDSLFTAPVDDRLTFPPASTFRNWPPSDMAPTPDGDDCLYCALKARVICTEHGARLCGRDACKELHCSVQRSAHCPFQELDEWKQQQPASMSHVAKMITFAGWLVAVALLCLAMHVWVPQ